MSFATPVEIPRPEPLWVPVASRWHFLYGQAPDGTDLRKTYGLNVDQSVEGIAVGMIDGQPAFVLGFYTEYLGSSHGRTDRRVLRSIPVAHLEPDDPRMEAPAQTFMALLPGLVLAESGERRPVVGVLGNPRGWGRIESYLVLRGGQIDWAMASGAVVEIEK